MSTSVTYLIPPLFSITDISVFATNDQNIETNFGNIEINNKFSSQITSTDHNVLLFEKITIVTGTDPNLGIKIRGTESGLVVLSQYLRQMKP